LVPRVLPVIAFIGAPLLLVSWFGVLFGLWPQRSTLTTLAAVPVAVFEFSLGVYLIVKGFKPSPITADMV
jgi:Na+/H+ antiporter NhaD/arsenite permease-like protein